MDLDNRHERPRGPFFGRRTETETQGMEMNDLPAPDHTTTDQNQAASPNHDLESQAGDTESQSPLKRYWWSTRFGKRAVHSPQTAAAHAKSPLQVLKDIAFSNYANPLVVFIPVGIALHFVPSIPPTVVFVMNFLAIVPLAAVSTPCLSCLGVLFLLSHFCFMRGLC
jgi:hypothetical protein